MVLSLYDKYDKDSRVHKSTGQLPNSLTPPRMQMNSEEMQWKLE